MELRIIIGKVHLFIFISILVLFSILMFVIAQSGMPNPGHDSKSIWVSGISGTLDQPLNNFLGWLKDGFNSLDGRVNNLEDVKWTSVSPLDSPYYSALLISSSTGGATIHDIPSTIPSSAKEVLVYAYVARGASGGSSFVPIDVSIYTYDGAYYLKKLTIINNANSAWVVNSDNMWLPITLQREIIAYLPQSLSGNVQSGIQIIGYR